MKNNAASNLKDNLPEQQIMPGSEPVINYGIKVITSPGTIDADSGGKVFVRSVNLSVEKSVIRDGERICQMIISKHKRAKREDVPDTGKTERCSGFAHSASH